jgi:tetratricopeptide (TPR) repeat protein
MALDRQKHKTLQAAERLLRQGKVQEALSTLERVALDAPSDLLTLNRLGDLLAKQGRAEEAIRYYLKIAEEFSNSGFYPKAIAIHKKILRLNPDDVQSLAQLGHLYLEQRLPGEARKYLLHAADLSLKAQDYPTARTVYEKLIEAEPNDPRHRARLAETRAAEGDDEQAGQELLLLADSLFTQGKPGDAEQTFRRAAELLPGTPAPLLGICKSVTEQGRGGEALEILEVEAGKDAAVPAIVGELAIHYATSGRDDDALEVLRRPGAREMPPDTLLRLFRGYVEAGQIDKFWQRMDPVLDLWAEQGSPERVEAVLGRLGTLEEAGHVPALQRLYELTAKAGDKTGMTRALESLVQAYRAHSMPDEADKMLQKLRETAPQSSLLTAGAAASPAEDAPEKVPTAARGTEALPTEMEAPAVPLNKNDEEFVAGRLTQAEILEKYGLLDQAIQQVREVTAKFPGHVPGQERVVTLLRGGANREPLREALIALALARRAVGDGGGAREAAGEADRIAAVSGVARNHLVQLGLLGATPEPAAAAPAAAEAAPSQAPPAEPVAAAQEPPPASDSSAPSDDSGVVIDFDAFEGEPGAGEPEPAPAGAEKDEPLAAAGAGGKQVRAPGADMLEEIRLHLRGGMPREAQQRIQTLRALGYSSPELDGLEQEIRGAVAQTPEQAPSPPADGKPVVEVAGEAPEPAAAADDSAEPAMPPTAGAADDDDLSTITAALESELFSEEIEAPVPEVQTEQSLEDVFAAFKRHVAEEVGSEDFRTHYDLGIAYKEMGLMDEAVAEFEVAAQSSEMAREAFIMLALCHRERQDPSAASEWYRRAIDAPGGDPESVLGLRYDLAELLLESGDAEAALQQFRAMLEADPSFRDVQERISQLEANLTS